jgi:hypothetical protein
VSNTPTLGIHGRTFSTASTPIRFAGLCNGAKSVNSLNVFLTSSVISVDLLKLSHPCTILCPTASISFKSFSAQTSGSINRLSTLFRATSWFSKNPSTSCLIPEAVLCLILLPSIHILSTSHLASTS